MCVFGVKWSLEQQVKPPEFDLSLLLLFVQMALVFLGKQRHAQRHNNTALQAALGKAKRLLADLQVEPTVNWHQLQSEHWHHATVDRKKGMRDQ